MKKNVLIFLLGGLVFSTISLVGAAIVYKANDIEYIPSDSNWKVDNVQDALDSINNNCLSKTKYIQELSELSERTFLFTGTEQKYTTIFDGTYKIELWGGAGIGAAYGGYTSGKIKLKKGEELYFYVGRNSVNNITSAFNSGSGSAGGYAGGGATDVRLVNGSWNNIDSLRSRIMVAAGGGSGNNAGAAGGLIGYSASTQGGTQTTFGASSSGYTIPSFGIANGGCSGGNGYYPGGGATCVYGAGGGSSYISGHDGCDAIKENGTHTGQSVHYSGLKFTDTVMIDGKGYSWTTEKGEQTNMPTFDGKSTMVGNSGSGYAKITLVSLD